MDLDRLESAVVAAFDVTGAATPPWPPPRPFGAEAREEEYSRCPDPDRFRIVAARARAWQQALVRLQLADVEPITDERSAWRERPVHVEGTIRLRPRRSGAAPLVFGFGSMHGVPETVLTIGAGDPAVSMVMIPDCGCDACDSGSDDLLTQIDEHVRAVVTGTLVHVTTPHGCAMTTEPDKWQATMSFSAVHIEELLEQARAGTSPHDTVHGRPWDS